MCDLLARLQKEFDVESHVSEFYLGKLPLDKLDARRAAQRDLLKGRATRLLRALDSPSDTEEDGGEESVGLSSQETDKERRRRRRKEKRRRRKRRAAKGKAKSSKDELSSSSESSDAEARPRRPRSAKKAAADDSSS